MELRKHAEVKQMQKNKKHFYFFPILLKQLFKEIN